MCHSWYLYFVTLFKEHSVISSSLCQHTIIIIIKQYSVKTRCSFLSQSTQRRYIKTVLPCPRHPATVPATAASAPSSDHHSKVRFRFLSFITASAVLMNIHRKKILIGSLLHLVSTSFYLLLHGAFISLAFTQMASGPYFIVFLCLTSGLWMGANVSNMHSIIIFKKVLVL